MAGTEALYAEDACLREFEAIVIGVKPDVAGWLSTERR
jgi:Ser-tRNA(Ala) deacylase AlaX